MGITVSKDRSRVDAERDTEASTDSKEKQEKEHILHPPVAGKEERSFLQHLSKEEKQGVQASPLKFLSGNQIKPVIRVRSNAVPKTNGCYARKEAVIEQQTFKPKSWSKIHRFGYRWRERTRA